MRKYASQLDNTVKEENLRSCSIIFPDVDRYASDRYDVNLELRKTIKGYSIGCLLLHSHIGVAAFTRYWHYEENERDLAFKIFDVIKEAAVKIRDEVTFNKLPSPTIAGKFREAFWDLDLPHRESTGIPNVNYSVSLTQESDPRETLYGNRYPDPKIEPLKSIKHYMEDSKLVTENKGRSKVIKYKYNK